MPTASRSELERAAEHLAKNDPHLAPIIKRAGLAAIKPHSNYYWELVDSIISQQLSVKAAASIEKRFQELFDSEFPEPAAILEKSVEELRAVGLSGAKARYVRDLAEHVLDGRLVLDNFDSMSNEEIITMLTDVKGIGEWTAHMFLIFSLGRLDILPVGDLGIRNGIRALYSFEDIPTPQQIKDLAAANNWAPYQSVASWYVWHSLDNVPNV
ncbi:MAG: DNA-3-methyladenine glycosylase [Candidatus Saccharibacteria bacterium]|nr:DNA-3-methyladenine glycosylase [Candidatus Saccharibacteria bacterium]